MSFGFSVGDFIAALELVGTVVASLRESGGAKAQFRELTQELFSLETALLRVKQLDFEDSQYGEYVALKQAACQCQLTIDGFWTKASKYQKHVLGHGKALSVKAAWMKVQWTLCKADELAKFKADIAAHTQSILVLLAALQMQRLDLQGKANSTGFNALRAFIQQSMQQCYDRIAQVSDAISGSIAQGEQILRHTTKIFQTNIRIFQVVCSIQTMLFHLPQQIERQQPIYMIDALGKISPFHLEFVRSADALCAVLKSNFENVPSGLRKIENNEFILRNCATGRRIDLSKDWDTCFLPGQRIEMRMIFNWNARERGVCPACQTKCPRIKGKSDTQCPNCGLTFARTVKLEDSPVAPPAEPSKVAVKHLTAVWAGLDETSTVRTRPPISAYDESDDVQYYRRVQIVSRKRRKLWHNLAPDPIEANIKEQDLVDLSTDVNETPFPEESHDQEAEIEGLDELNDIIDITTFKQLLEMDEEVDDEDERAFSREICLGQFSSLEATLEKIRPLVYAPDTSLSELSHWGHFLKGTPYTTGLHKMGRTAWEIQVVAAWRDRPDWLPDQFRYIKTEEDVRRFVRGNFESFEEQLKVAKARLQDFYKVPQDQR
jgi:hypothetical protein